MIVETVKKDCS